MAVVVFAPDPALGGPLDREKRFERSELLREGGLALYTNTHGDRKLCILMDCADREWRVQMLMSKAQARSHGWRPRDGGGSLFAIVESVHQDLLQPMEGNPCPMYCGWCNQGERHQPAFSKGSRDYYWLGPEFPDPHAYGILCRDALEQHSKAKHPRKIPWGIPAIKEYADFPLVGESGTELSIWEPAITLREGGVAKLVQLDGQECDLLCIIRNCDTHGLWTVDIKMNCGGRDWVRQVELVQQEYLLPCERSPCPMYCGYCYAAHLREDLPKALNPSGYFWCCGLRDPCSRGFESDHALEQHTRTWHPRRSPWGEPVTTLAEEHNDSAPQSANSIRWSASGDTWRSKQWWSTTRASSSACSDGWWSDRWYRDDWSSAYADRWASSSEPRNTEAKHLESANEEHCVVCFERDLTGTIVHGETGHNCTCIECARALKASSKPCPICREPIDMVIKVFKS